MPTDPGYDPEKSPAWTIDPHVGKPYGYHRSLPESPTSGWIRKNFTLGNLIIIVTMLLAAGAWMRSAETQDTALKDRMHQAEARMERLAQDTISKELLGAKLDTIAAELQAIKERLAKIERLR